jgi:3-deoxy-D-arabino-heptulosonate 7-phosphate (DAHP) synthase class II
MKKVTCQRTASSFHETHWFFKVFEITRTSGSLILNFFQRSGSGGSLILEHLKNWNQGFFKNSKNHMTLQMTTSWYMEVMSMHFCVVVATGKITAAAI